MASTVERPASRARAGLMLGFVAVLTVALLAGLVYYIAGWVGNDDTASAHTASGGDTNVIAPATLVEPAGVTDQQRKDSIAAATMVSVPNSAAQVHSKAPGVAPTLPVPAPKAGSRVGLVAVGYPKTAAGAVAQFAAIDAAAIAGLNPSQVASVYADWSLPGADPVEQWSVMTFTRAVLRQVGSPDGASTVDATFTPLEAQVKGTVGVDWAVVCVNGEFDVSANGQSSQVGAADCARMEWVNGRWRIAAGSQPAPPPNVWPGTAESRAAGWKVMTDARR